MSPRLLAAAFLFFIVPPASAELLKVGLIQALSGPVEVYGKGAQNGFELALKDMGPGRIQAVYEDDQFKPAAGISAFTKLTEADGVDAVICLGSSICAALAPIAQARKTALIAWASDSRISKGNEYVLRINPSGEVHGGETASIVKKRGYEKIALVTATNEYSESFSRGLLSALAPRQALLEEEVSPQETDFKAVLARVRASGARALGFCLRPGQVGLFGRQLQEMDLRLQLFACETLHSASEAEAARGGLEGSWFVEAHVREEFRKRYQEQFKSGDVMSTAAAYYDIAFLLVEAGKLHGRELIEKIVSLKRRGGALRDFGFKVEDGDRFIDAPSALITLKDGRFVYSDL